MEIEYIITPKIVQLSDQNIFTVECETCIFYIYLLVRCHIELTSHHDVSFHIIPV